MKRENHPQVSVIMAAHNAEKYIAESIESILNQTFKNFELIIINDASDDGTLTVINQYAQKDPRIIIKTNSINLYATESRNIGLKVARGDYIAIQDADDISFPERLALQYQYLKKNKNIFLLGSGAIDITENGEIIRTYKPVHGVQVVKKTLEKRNCLYHSTVMFRNCGLLYRSKMRNSEDYDFYLTLLSKGKSLDNIPQPLVYYRILPTSVSRSNPLEQILFAEQAKKFYEQRKGGEDEYSVFSPAKIAKIISEDQFNKSILIFEIKSAFYSGRFVDARKKCLTLFKYHGALNKMLIFFLATFFGRVVLTIKKFI